MSKVTKGRSFLLWNVSINESRYCFLPLDLLGSDIFVILPSTWDSSYSKCL